MEKKEVKFVRLFPSEGKKLKVTVVNRFFTEDPPIDYYCDDGYIVPEDEIIAINEVEYEEWEKGRKDYYCGVCRF